MSKDAKVAIVTGGNRGLGRAIALGLAKEGISLVLTARDQAALDAVAAEAKAAGAPDVLTVAADLSMPEAPGKVVADAVAHFGRVDILVNNAGDTKRGDFLELTDADHLSGFALKYHATVRFCRAAWPFLAKAKGCIVNISGVGAHTPEAEFSIGGPVNSALINFTKAISKRADADGIRVNNVSPGHIVTDRLSRRIDAHAKQKGISFDAAKEEMRQERGILRYGEAHEIGDFVVFLCSDKAAYIHGATLTIDGGATPGI